MATITYAYGIDATVYHMSGATGVRKAIVRKVDASVTPGPATAVDYTIAFVDASQGVINALEATLFADVDSALAAYRALVV